MFPRFVRTIPSEIQANMARFALMKLYDWSRVATLHETQTIFSLVSVYVCVLAGTRVFCGCVCILLLCVCVCVCVCMRILYLGVCCFLVLYVCAF